MGDEQMPPTSANADTFSFDRHTANARSAYERERPKYERFATALREMLRVSLLDKRIRVHDLEARAKALESFAEKASRPSEVDPTIPKYRDPIAEIKDKAGARIITFLPETIAAVETVIREQFVVTEKVDHSASALEDERFGYKSVHFVVQLTEQREGLPEYKEFSGAVAEVQVRTILQHAWAEIEHDIQYKSDVGIPKDIRRRLQVLAGLLELADREFQAIDEADRSQRRNTQASIDAGQLQDLSLTPDALKAFLDRRLGADDRISRWSYQSAVRMLVSLGIDNVEALDAAITGVDDDELSRAVYGTRQGQLTRLELVLLATLREAFIERHPLGRYPYIADSYRRRLEMLRHAGLARLSDPRATPRAPETSASVPKTASELFDDLVPLALAKFPHQAKDIHASYIFRIPGDGGGVWTIDLKSDPPTCRRGEFSPVDATIDVTAEDFQRMLHDPSIGLDLYKSRRVRVSGDPHAVMKLQHLFMLANPGVSEPSR